MPWLRVPPTADGQAGPSQAQPFPPVCSQPKGDPDWKQNVHKRGDSILPQDLRAWLPEVRLGTESQRLGIPTLLTPLTLAHP